MRAPTIAIMLVGEATVNRARRSRLRNRPSQILGESRRPQRLPDRSASCRPPGPATLSIAARGVRLLLPPGRRPQPHAGVEDSIAPWPSNIRAARSTAHRGGDRRRTAVPIRCERPLIAALAQCDRIVASVRSASPGSRARALRTGGACNRLPAHARREPGGSRWLRATARGSPVRHLPSRKSP